MRSILLAALSVAVSSVFGQAVPEGIAPEAPPPPGCKQTVPGNFTIGIAAISKARRGTAAEAAVTALSCTLTDGILRDPFGRTASIVANYQFQFDGPPQAGAIYTGGFSVCQNSSLALGGSTVWWRCMSGEFGNLYDRTIGDQCAQIRIVAQLPNAVSSSSASVIASSSASVSTFASDTASPSPVTSMRNQTMATTAVPSGSGSVSLSATPISTFTRGGSAPTPPPNGSTGVAPIQVPQRGFAGVAIAILLGAARIL